MSLALFGGYLVEFFLKLRMDMWNMRMKSRQFVEFLTRMKEN